MMAHLYLRAPLVGQHAQNQQPGDGSLEWNAAIIKVITPVVFLLCIVKYIYFEDGILMHTTLERC